MGWLLPIVTRSPCRLSLTHSFRRSQPGRKMTAWRDATAVQPRGGGVAGAMRGDGDALDTQLLVQRLPRRDHDHHQAGRTPGLRRSRYRFADRMPDALRPT